MENKQEITKFFKKYFELEHELGAAYGLNQFFHTLDSEYQIFIERFTSSRYPRKIAVSKDSSIFYNPEPSDLVNLVRDNFQADSNVEIVFDEGEVRDYNRQLDEWRNKRDLRANVKLDLEFKPIKVGDKEFEVYMNSIKSEAEQIRKEFWDHHVEFKYPISYKIIIDGDEFMQFRRLPTHFGIILGVSPITFSGTNDEIVNFAETVDKTIEACYQRTRGDKT
jgi:hypothetical protein